LAGLVVAVNVSAVQFVRREWLDELLALVGRHGVSPRRIEIELTEAVALRDPEGAVRTIGKLHEAGFRIALDDFGTGFSSLTYLRRFAIDKLKIDQGFISGIEQSPGNQEIVKAIIRMGHGLDMRVIAEGVEEESAVRFLSEQGCDEIQGYVCSRPLDAEAFVDFARRATGVDAAR
jgi:EAL domain-containing protein (putative c-di-GMP-specific phosphodiesterase class I)